MEKKKIVKKKSYVKNKSNNTKVSVKESNKSRPNKVVKKNDTYAKKKSTKTTKPKVKSSVSKKYVKRKTKKTEYHRKTIYLGADHAGFKLKEKIKNWLIDSNIPFLDLGNMILDNNDDYPDFAIKVSNMTSSSKSKGILICGSGQGMCMAANKVKGIRAGIAYSTRDARLLREHNDANVICLSGWGISLEDAKKIIKKFIDTKFSSEPRHKRRVIKITKLE